MRNFLYIAFLFLTVLGCKPGIPRNIIQPEKMSSVLSDIHVVDGYIMNIPNVDSAKKVASAYYKGIYKKYGIDSVLYVKSMDYYNSNPKAMDAVYTTVVADLTAQKKDILKADSIASVKMLRAMRLKTTADSIKKAGPEYHVKLLLRDTTKRIPDYIQFKMNYKVPKD